MLAQPLSGISIREDKLFDDPKGVISAFNEFINSGLKVLDLRDSWTNYKLLEDVFESIKKNRDVLVIGRFKGIYPNYEHVLEQIAALKEKIGRPIDVFEVKLPSFLVSFNEALRAIKKAFREGLILGFGIVGWKSSYLDKIRLEGVDEVLKHVKVDLNLLNVKNLSLAMSLNKMKISVFSSSPLGGGLLTEAGYSSLRNRILHSSSLRSLRNISLKKGASMAQVALSWLSYFKVSFAPSTSKPLHVREIAESLRLRLSEEEVKELNGSF